MAFMATAHPLLLLSQCDSWEVARTLDRLQITRCSMGGDKCKRGLSNRYRSLGRTWGSTCAQHPKVRISLQPWLVQPQVPGGFCVNESKELCNSLSASLMQV